MQFEADFEVPKAPYLHYAAKYTSGQNLSWGQEKIN